MAAKGEDKLLDVLRTLRPPGTPGRTTGNAPSAPAGAEGSPPQDPAPRPLAPTARGGGPGAKIELRLEEVGVFFLAAVVLVVLAFLLGWYGRGLAGGGREGGREPAGGRASAKIPIAEPVALDLGSRAAGVKALSSAPATYSILAARLPRGAEAEAEDYRRLAEDHGFTPAWLRATGRGVEICVGRFGSPADALALEWLPKVRRLHEAFGTAQMVRLPQE